MIKSLLLRIVFEISKKFVPFISKKIYPEKKIKEHIETDVRSTQPITITLNKEIPEISVYLKVTNKSPYLDVEFDRCEFSLWLKSSRGQQPLTKISVMSKELVKKGESKIIYCNEKLTESQVKFVKNIKNINGVTADLQSLNIWFNSSLYPAFVKREDLENKPTKIE